MRARERGFPAEKNGPCASCCCHGSIVFVLPPATSPPSESFSFVSSVLAMFRLSSCHLTVVRSSWLRKGVFLYSWIFDAASAMSSLFSIHWIPSWGFRSCVWVASFSDDHGETCLVVSLRVRSSFFQKTNAIHVNAQSRPCDLDPVVCSCSLTGRNMCVSALVFICPIWQHTQMAFRGENKTTSERRYAEMLEHI